MMMPPKPASKKPDPGPPPYWVAAADIPAPYDPESGVMPEVMVYAGDRVPAHMVPDQVDPALVLDPREPEPAGSSEEN